MARFVAGDVIVLPFPDTNQTAGKIRPAVVVGSTSTGDLLVCMITSAGYGGEIMPLDGKNQQSSGLRVASSVRPERLLVASSDLVVKKTGRISKEMTDAIKSRIVSFIMA
jgi:mRNA interferase MazF